MRGKLRVEGQEEVRFWVRVFRLEQWVERAVGAIVDREQGRYASVPVVSEYEVSERMGFYYFLLIEVDALGVEGGSGLIWVSGRAQSEEVRAERDKLADEILATMAAKRGRPFDEAFEIEPGRE